MTSADASNEKATVTKTVEESSQSGYYSDGTSSQVSVESAGSKPGKTWPSRDSVRIESIVFYCTPVYKCAKAIIICSDFARGRAESE